MPLSLFVLKTKQMGWDETNNHGKMMQIAMDIPSG